MTNDMRWTNKWGRGENADTDSDKDSVPSAYYLVDDDWGFEDYGSAAVAAAGRTADRRGSA
jgi:hypothetical protein